MSRPSIRAFLEITDFTCEPEAISRALGVEASQTWKSGDLMGPSGPKRKASGWRLEAPATDGYAFEDRAGWLLGQLPPSLDTLASVTGDWDAQLSFVVEVADETPAMYFSREMLARITQLRASIDIDIYLTMSKR